MEGAGSNVLAMPCVAVGAAVSGVGEGEGAGAGAGAGAGEGAGMLEVVDADAVAGVTGTVGAVAGVSTAVD